VLNTGPRALRAPAAVRALRSFREYLADAMTPGAFLVRQLVDSGEALFDTVATAWTRPAPRNFAVMRSSPRGPRPRSTTTSWASLLESVRRSTGLFMKSGFGLGRASRVDRKFLDHGIGCRGFHGRKPGVQPGERRP